MCDLFIKLNYIDLIKTVILFYYYKDITNFDMFLKKSNIKLKKKKFKVLDLGFLSTYIYINI